LRKPTVFRSSASLLEGCRGSIPDRSVHEPRCFHQRMTEDLVFDRRCGARAPIPTVVASRAGPGSRDESRSRVRSRLSVRFPPTRIVLRTGDRLDPRTKLLMRTPGGLGVAGARQCRTWPSAQRVSRPMGAGSATRTGEVNVPLTWGPASLCYLSIPLVSPPITDPLRTHFAFSTEVSMLSLSRPSRRFDSRRGAL
jgi:hypothetical protein